MIKNRNAAVAVQATCLLFVEKIMRSPDDLWEAVGTVSGEESLHVLTKLFDIYEQQLKKYPDSREALQFFQHLDNALTLTMECNLNRR